jgi:hypothetical protein
MIAVRPKALHHADWRWPPPTGWGTTGCTPRRRWSGARARRLGSAGRGRRRADRGPRSGPPGRRRRAGCRALNNFLGTSPHGRSTWSAATASPPSAAASTRPGAGAVDRARRVRQRRHAGDAPCDQRGGQCVGPPLQRACTSCCGRPCSARRAASCRPRRWATPSGRRGDGCGACAPRGHAGQRPCRGPDAFEAMLRGDRPHSSSSTAFNSITNIVVLTVIAGLPPNGCATSCSAHGWPAIRCRRSDVTPRAAADRRRPPAEAVVALRGARPPRRAVVRPDRIAAHRAGHGAARRR